MTWDPTEVSAMGHPSLNPAGKFGWENPWKRVGETFIAPGDLLLWVTVVVSQNWAPSFVFRYPIPPNIKRKTNHNFDLDLDGSTVYSNGSIHFGITQVT
jgi:hypothetical protein